MISYGIVCLSNRRRRCGVIIHWQSIDQLICLWKTYATELGMENRFEKNLVCKGLLAQMLAF